MYQVLARKWRPQGFADLVGQKHVAQTLSNAIVGDRLAHAYILAGLRGTGKTTVARILAKCLNCEKGPSATPCDTCASCEEIAGSRSMDVLEIDAASRTKVEQTRELLEMVSYAPVRDRNKILIIDEAHMLSKASFNALLKTLEEPPPNVVFLLATTELQKILPTILSRCQIFEFRRVSVRELAAHLRRICDAEKIEIPDAALERIARAGEGSVRDSLSVLERVLAFCGETVSEADVLRMLGGVRSEVLCKLIRGIADRDAGAMLTVLDGIVDEGHDLLHFWNELLAALRDLLLVQAIPGRDDLLTRSTDEASALREASGDLTRDDLTRAFQLLADLEPSLKGSAQPRFLFEAAMVRLAGLGALRPIEEVLEQFSAPTTGLPRPSGPPRSPSPPKSAPPRKKTAAPREKKSPEPESSASAASAAPAAPEPASPVVAAGGDALRDRLIAAVVEHKPMIGTMLEQTSSIAVDDGVLLVCFTGSQAHLARPLERDDNKRLLVDYVKSITGEAVRVRIVTDAQAPAAETAAPAVHEAPAPPAEPEETRPPSQPALPRPPAPSAEARKPSPVARAEPPAAPPSEAPPAPTRRREPRVGSSLDPKLLSTAKAEPGVQKLLREFGAQIVGIQPHEDQAESEES